MLGLLALVLLSLYFTSDLQYYFDRIWDCLDGGKTVE